jgi:hypothetical protein
LPWKKIIKLIIKDARTVPHPIMVTALLGKTFLPNPLTRKPMNGKTGIKKIKFFMFKLSAISYQLSAQG